MLYSRVRRSTLAGLVVALTVTALADGGANHRIASDQYGTSGGNINDRTKAFCCSGTLGALVSDGSNRYILSNNHVLARGNQAAIGEDVSQPGMIDLGCQIGERVADLAAYPLVGGGSNVDAALAVLRPGAMSADGSILDIGVPSATTAAPAVNMSVAKSGRTTGFTTGTIGSINTSVSVQYQERCNAGRKFVVSYTNQIVINSSTFSAGGDSGSLIVTNNSSHNPVGLLFAGSSSTTIANPIGEVLSRVGQAIGATVSFTLPSGGGGGRGGAAGGAAQGGGPQASESALSPAEIARGSRAKETHAGRLMADPDVVAVGVGEDPDAPGQAAVVVYVKNARARGAIARQLDGVRTHIVETDEIRAFGWNQPMGASCR